MKQKERIDRVIELANASVRSERSMDDPMQLECRKETMKLCEEGIDVRLAALDECHRIKDIMTQQFVIGEIVTGGPMPGEGIEREAIWHLANSSMSEHWNLLTELAIVFERSLAKNEFKDAFVIAWKKAEGVTKEDLAYTLRRYGFKCLFGFWR